MSKFVGDDVTVDFDDVKPVVVETVRPNGRIRVDHMNYEKSLTQQHFSESADINNIMRRWLNGGPPPVSDASRAVFRDVSHGMDYQTMINTTMAVQESFDSLPADIRARFKNSPSELLDFVADPANEKSARELGLLFEDSASMVNVPTQDANRGGVNVGDPASKESEQLAT